MNLDDEECYVKARIFWCGCPITWHVLGKCPSDWGSEPCLSRDGLLTLSPAWHHDMHVEPAWLRSAPNSIFKPNVVSWVISGSISSSLLSCQPSCIEDLLKRILSILTWIRQLRRPLTGPPSIAEMVWSRSRQKFWIFANRPGASPDRKWPKVKTSQNPSPDKITQGTYTLRQPSGQNAP